MNESMPPLETVNGLIDRVATGSPASQCAFVAENRSLLNTGVIAYLEESGQALLQRAGGQNVAALYTQCADFLRRQFWAYMYDHQLAVLRAEPALLADETSDRNLRLLLAALPQYENEQDILQMLADHLPALTLDQLDQEILGLVAAVRAHDLDLRRKGEISRESAAQRLLVARDLARLAQRDGFVEAIAFLSAAQLTWNSSLFHTLCLPLTGEARRTIVSRFAARIAVPEFSDYVRNFVTNMKAMGEDLGALADPILNLAHALNTGGLPEALNSVQLREWFSNPEGMPLDENMRRPLLARALRRTRNAATQRERRSWFYGYRDILASDDVQLYYEDHVDRFSAPGKDKFVDFLSVEEETLHRIREVGVEAAFSWVESIVEGRGR